MVIHSHGYPWFIGNGKSWLQMVTLGIKVDSTFCGLCSRCPIDELVSKDMASTYPKLPPTGSYDHNQVPDVEIDCAALTEKDIEDFAFNRNMTSI